jgi:hypothetical protein
MAEADAEVNRLPYELWFAVADCLKQGYHDIEQLGGDTLTALKERWDERLQHFWQHLVVKTWLKLHHPMLHYDPSDPSCSPNSPLELDHAMLQHGETSQRVLSKNAPWLPVDSKGFLEGPTGPADINAVSWTGPARSMGSCLCR